MARGRQKKLTMLQANDSMAYPAPVLNATLLTDEQIHEALANYKSSGIRLELTDSHWLIILKKDVRNTKGQVVGSGDVKVTGTRNMPIKDFLYSVRELLIPITPMTV